MPFEKYLQHSQDEHSQSYLQRGNDVPPVPISTTDSIFSPFHLPNFMYNGPPTLALGEVLPSSVPSPWFSNSGFTPKHFQPSLFESPSKANVVLDSQLHLQPSFYGLGTTIPPTGMSGFIPASPANHSPPFPFPVPSSGTFSPPSEVSLSANNLAVAPSAPHPSFVLPVYSTSGFDVLPILARVANRPHPRIVLGPVDLTCSFVVVDVRRHDSPIVYYSPAFSQLTGYQCHEILGRNCRFLQSPGGLTDKHSPRSHIADAVAHLKKNLMDNQECQTTIINYKKSGKPFINLVTVIPITGGVSNEPHEADEVVYHVGFQVDLMEQPNAIMEKLRDGSFMVDYCCTSSIPLAIGTPTRDRKSQPLRVAPMSDVLRSLLTQPRFIQSLPITSSTTISSTSSDKIEVPETNQILNLILLESLPDFIHVVSLKGFFLYVAPAVRHVLGYEPEELVGKSIEEFCHKADVVPLMRELKESSITPGQVQDLHSQQPTLPKTVDMLFRARTKAGRYVWVESRGRLHVEPGKGRKAIILSGRSRGMPHLKWESIARAGGLTPSVSTMVGAGGRVSRRLDREFWGMLSPDGTFLVVGIGISDVLGWEVEDIIGKTLGFLVSNNDSGQALRMELIRASEHGSCQTSPLLSLRTKKGGHAGGNVILYPSFDRPPSVLSPCQIVCQIRLADLPASPPPLHFAHSLSANVFEELETSRGSSWQYELERLRFENQRLTDEIEALEKKQLGAVSHSPMISASTSTSTVLDQQRHHPLFMRHVHLDNQHVLFPPRMSSSLKRSWNSRGVGPT